MYKHCSECQKQYLCTTCSPRFELGIFMYSMNNFSSYCGLVDAKIRASDKDLPVHKCKKMMTWVGGRGVKRLSKIGDIVYGRLPIHYS